MVAYVIGLAIQKTIGFRITEEDEVEGIDSVEHAESAYDFATAGGGGGAPHRGQPGAPAQADAEARGVNA